jgi:hypothetical protein
MIMRISTEEAGGASTENALIEVTSYNFLNPRKKGSTDQPQFIQLQTTANLENGKKLRKGEEETAIQMQTQTDNLRSTKSGNPQMRLLTDPKKFSGAVAEYIQWKRTWQEEKEDSYTEESQLKQLKLSIPARTSNLMGLSEIRTVADFWSLIDRKYYSALSKSAVAFAIADVKSLDREDSGFLQKSTWTSTTWDTTSPATKW